MLLASLDDVKPGMAAAAVVLHPRRPELELLAAGTVLDAPMIERLRELGVTELWVHHDALADLDQQISPELIEARRGVYRKIKETFTELASQTLTTAHILAYKQVLTRLVFELVGNRKVAGLTDALFNSEHALFAHSANVAYLATLTGLELENYVVSQRSRLDFHHARDLTNLGLGAMLHDIGKLLLPPEFHDLHECDVLADDPQRHPPQYLEHPAIGFQMLSNTPVAATAKQVVLNHHQRFDGFGWPDVTRFCRRGQPVEQIGTNIHIFCRVVAAANVLDNLLRSPDGRRRPPVAALYDLASPRFDGWFDPMVRQTILRKLPPFQVGSLVRLSNGQPAAVISPNIRQPCRPVVRLLESPDGGQSYPTIFLENRPDLRIVECAGMDVSRWYFELPEPRKLKVG